MTDGSEIKVDREYLRESILDPERKVREGALPSMPMFRGKLPEKQLETLVHYIEHLK